MFKSVKCNINMTDMLNFFEIFQQFHLSYIVILSFLSTCCHAVYVNTQDDLSPNKVIVTLNTFFAY